MQGLCLQFPGHYGDPGTLSTHQWGTCKFTCRSRCRLWIWQLPGWSLHSIAHQLCPVPRTTANPHRRLQAEACTTLQLWGLPPHRQGTSRLQPSSDPVFKNYLRSRYTLIDWKKERVQQHSHPLICFPNTHYSHSWANAEAWNLS